MHLHYFVQVEYFEMYRTFEFYFKNMVLRQTDDDTK